MKIEWNNYRCFLSILNAFLVVIFGYSMSWITLCIAILGIIKDVSIDKKNNSFIMHLTNTILSIYFLFGA
jgi:hypothetical protein